MSNYLFEGSDPFADPAWQKVTGNHKRAERLIGCPLPWFEWLLPLVKTKDQLAFALYLYRRCCICGTATVTVPTREFAGMGISRYGKYRLLAALEQAGIVRIEPAQFGQVGSVTLTYWPNPPPPTVTP